MEEKERYVYHEVSNEVEQYECYYDTEECCELFDNEDILNRLNQQDKRIKELETCLDEEIESNVNLYNLQLKTEQENQQLKQQLEETKQNCNYQVMLMCSKENILLKQQLHDLPKKIEKQIKVLEKALELACERIKYFEEMQDREMGHFELFGYENEYDLQAIVKNYIDKAKEMLENENSEM